MNLFKPFTPAQAAAHFDQYFEKIARKNPARPLQIRVTSQNLGLDYAFPSGSADQPFHVASVGKLFTSALAQMLAARRLFSIQNPIHPFFSPAELDRLFVYQGVDGSGQVTVEQLLAHTSGAADYFEGSVEGSASFFDEVLSKPDTHWTPQALLDFSRQHQSAVGAPGQVFNYSDTGYILLGLLIERVTGKSFALNLQEEFFRPLQMADTYLMFYDDPAAAPRRPIEKIWFNGQEISAYQSLSCDWAGGGVISTTADLLKFNRALRSGQLVPPQALAAMDVCIHKFQPGIYYGVGMMEIRFGDFFFLLGRLPKVKGHIGILSTHLFYDSIKDTHIAMNFGDNTRMVESFKALIEIENTLQRLR